MDSVKQFPRLLVEIFEQKRIKSQRASALVEAAIVIPVLALILMGIIQWGYIFGAHLTLKNASVAAARYSILTLPSPSKSDVENMAKSSVAPMLLPGLTDADFNPSAAVSCGGSCTVNGKQVTLKYDLDLFFPFVVPGSSNGKLELNVSSIMG